MRVGHTAFLPFLLSLVAAEEAPTVGGMHVVWSETFAGAAGACPDTKVWNIATAIDTNDEVETYTESNNNLQISGGGTVQFVPRKSSTGLWTSGRIESVDSWTPAAGKVMMVAAKLRLGGNSQAEKQGVWPAFWMLGEAVRQGTPWPTCGEIDIFEQVDGVMTGHGTLHCGTDPGGPCDETTGLTGSTALPDNDFHVWSVKIDLTNSDWKAQSINFQMDGATYSTVTGAQLNNQAVWSTLAHSPMYMILNVAVGGDWPGPPNAATVDGYGAMMEVAYAAVYST